MTNTIKLFTTTKTINNAIAKIGKWNKELDAYCQKTICSIIAHNEEHGDTGPANRLLKVLPAGARKAAYIAFMEKYSKLVFMQEKEDKNGVMRKFNQFAYIAEKPADMEGAVNDNWTKYKPEVAYKPVTTKGVLESAYKRLVAAQEKGNPEDNIDQDVLARLGDLLKSL